MFWRKIKKIDPPPQETLPGDPFVYSPSWQSEDTFWQFDKTEHAKFIDSKFIDRLNRKEKAGGISAFFSSIKAEWIILCVSLILGGFFAWYVHYLGLTQVFVDETAHLNISRQVVDSMTPGITQFGFWPPLLHVVLVPFISIDILYRTGLAGAFALVPFLCIASFFLYKMLFVFTENRKISILGAVLFLLNPYILYYAAVPMMEILFISNLFGVAYFLAQWLKTGKLFHFLGTAAFVAIASVSRFEGLFLVFLVGFIIFLTFIRQKRKYHEIEALLIIFYFIAVLGVLFTFLYGWAFGNNPFVFLNGDWSAFSQQRNYFLPTEHNILASLQYLLHASYYMIGKPQMFIAFACFLLLLGIRRNAKIIAVGMVLFSPFIFDWLSLYKGNTIVYIPELAPFGLFSNERYGLYWIGFTVFTPIVLAHLIRPKNPITENYQSIKRFAASFLIAAVILFNIFSFGQTAFLDKFKFIRYQESPKLEDLKMSEILLKNYDFGKVLMTRAFNDYIVINTDLPLKSYIQESNYQFYDQSLVRPWIFARFVLMVNVANDKSAWVQKNEKVAAYWGNSETFREYYSLIGETNSKRLYKLKDDAVRKYAADRGYNLPEIPSLNSNISWWKPGEIYEKMNAVAYKNEWEPNINLSK